MTDKSKKIRNNIKKLDLIYVLSKKYPEYTKEQFSKMVDIFFDDISTALVCGDRIELRGFGSMVVRKRKTKVARNPKTNERIEVGEKGSLYFRASKELIKSVNEK